jgi:hypothetical protein
VSTIKISKNGTIENMPYIILNGIKCATFGHNQLDKDEDDEHYTILCSTFWSNRILSIFETTIFTFSLSFTISSSKFTFSVNKAIA